ncbi:hypothetical protein HanRHA438_Chr03g0134851 [Helianthus annuus]|nr:hypothetical protein HanRHA438_Chr03g0134851 [Helianthus annuus]
MAFLHYLMLGTSGINNNHLIKLVHLAYLHPLYLREFTSPDGNHGVLPSMGPGKSTVTEQPLERLLKAVKSISPTALSASVSDIGSVVSMIDRIAGSAPG